METKLPTLMLLATMAVGCGGKAVEDGHTSAETDAGPVDSAVLPPNDAATGADAPRETASVKDGSPDAIADSGSPPSDAASDIVFVSECPTSPPSGACPYDGHECWYGTDPRIECRSRAECKQGSWSVETPDPAFCSEQTSPSCPSDPLNPVAGICQNTAIGYPYCLYEDHIVCGCQEWGAGMQWDCYQEPNTGCPTQVPNAGTAACDLLPGETCEYGYGCYPFVLGCVQGYWYVIAKGGSVVICN